MVQLTTFILIDHYYSNSIFILFFKNLSTSCIFKETLSHYHIDWWFVGLNSKIYKCLINNVIWHYVELQYLELCQFK